MANSWVEHVRKWSADHGVSYMCATSMPACKEAYKKGKAPKNTQKANKEQMGMEDKDVALPKKAKQGISADTLKDKISQIKEAKKMGIEDIKSALLRRAEGIVQPLQSADTAVVKPKGRPKKYATAEEARRMKSVKTVEARKARKAKEASPVVVEAPKAPTGAKALEVLSNPDLLKTIGSFNKPKDADKKFVVPGGWDKLTKWEDNSPRQIKKYLDAVSYKVARRANPSSEYYKGVIKFLRDYSKKNKNATNADVWSYILSQGALNTQGDNKYRDVEDMGYRMRQKDPKQNLLYNYLYDEKEAQDANKPYRDPRYLWGDGYSGGAGTYDAEHADEMVDNYSMIINHLVEHISDPSEPVDPRDYDQAIHFIREMRRAKGGAELYSKEYYGGMMAVGQSVAEMRQTYTTKLGSLLQKIARVSLKGDIRSVVPEIKSRLDRLLATVGDINTNGLYAVEQYTDELDNIAEDLETHMRGGAYTPVRSGNEFLDVVANTGHELGQAHPASKYGLNPFDMGFKVGEKLGNAMMKTKWGNPKTGIFSKSFWTPKKHH